MGSRNDSLTAAQGPVLLLMPQPSWDGPGMGHRLMVPEEAWSCPGEPPVSPGFSPAAPHPWASHSWEIPACQAL